MANAVVWRKKCHVKDHVPDVMGMTFRDAIYLLEKSVCAWFTEGKGRVAEQSILSTKLPRGVEFFANWS